MLGFSRHTGNLSASADIRRRLSCLPTIAAGVVAMTLALASEPAWAQGEVLLSENFESDAGGFVQVDDPFYGTSEPTYATGGWPGNNGYGGSKSLWVGVGGVDNDDILDMSSGVSANFTVPYASPVTVSFLFQLWDTGYFESDECQQVMLAIDGTVVQVNGNDYVYRDCADGFSGWRLATVDAGTLSAGTHTLTIGAYANKKTEQPEIVYVDIDNVDVKLAPILSADFGTYDDGYDPAEDLDGFTYSDDTFYGTSQPNYATSGWMAYSDAYVRVALGGVDGADIDDMSGGWSVDFTLPSSSEVTLDFLHRIWADDSFEPDECYQFMVSLDGTVVQDNGNDYFYYDCGGAENLPWYSENVDLGLLAEGTHTLTFGGYLNRKTYLDENAYFYLDDVTVNAVPTIYVNDVQVSVGEAAGAQSFAYDVDAPGSTLTFTLLSQPAEGTAVDNGDGTFTFDPGQDFLDLDEGRSRIVSFTYEADNGTLTDTATITVTVQGSGIGGDLNLPWRSERGERCRWSGCRQVRRHAIGDRQLCRADRGSARNRRTAAELDVAA